MKIDYSTLTKRYYSIGEVARLFDVKPSVLRFWEDNFKELKPRKSGGGNRLYTADNIKMIERIYHLTRDEGYTLDGAQKTLRQNKDGSKALDEQEVGKVTQRLSRVQKRLKQVLRRIDYYLDEME